MATEGNEVVIDTNVWVMTDYDIEDLDSLALIDCVDRCRQYLTEFRDGTKALVVDLDYHILGEYRRNVRQGRFAYEVIGLLEKTEGRIVYVRIDFENSHAVIPTNLSLDRFDPEDRKFVAVALARNPRPPIYNARDPDWSEHKEALEAAGLTIIELCPQVIRSEERSR